MSNSTTAVPLAVAGRRAGRGSVFTSRVEPARNRVDDRLAPARAFEALGQRAQVLQPLGRGRRLHGDVGDHFVLEHARARHVARLRLALAPGRDLDQHGEFLRLAHAGLEPLPGVLRIHAVGIGRGQHLHLLLHPVDAAAAAEVFDQRQIDVAQMRHVGDGVGELRVGKRPPRPVGEAVRFVERVAGDALHQLVVGDGIAIAEHHGGDLGIEDRMRNELGAVPDDFDVLPRGVKDLHDLFVRHQREERREIDVRRQRVDHHGLVGRGHLRHAKQRIIGGLAQEFGVDGDEGVGRHAPAHGGEFGRRRDRLHRGCGESDAIVDAQCRSDAARAGKAGTPVSRVNWLDPLALLPRTRPIRMNSQGLGIGADRNFDQGRAVAAGEGAPQRPAQFVPASRPAWPSAPKLSAKATKSGLARSLRDQPVAVALLLDAADIAEGAVVEDDRRPAECGDASRSPSRSR